LDYLSGRKGLILDYLRGRGAATVHELQRHLGISSATVYRDIAALVSAGLVHRSHGRLSCQQPDHLVSPRAGCVMCGVGVDQRTAVSLRLDDGTQIAACCPHCGLMYIAHEPKVISALATDYLYGKIHNVRQAVFVLESQVQICCAPSLLCFAKQEDASRFQTGFGGQVLTFEQAIQALQHMMALNSGLPR
jgi:DeoR family transcriptional regulator, copper-sensing transcriptional repressor